MTGNKYIAPPLCFILSLCGAGVFAQSSQTPNSITNLQSVVIDAPHFARNFIQGTLKGDSGRPVRIVYGDELTVQADEASGNFLSRDFTAIGHVSAREEDTTLTALSLQFHGNQGLGSGTGVMLYQRPYQLRAGTLDVVQTPASFIAGNASFSTASLGTHADLELRAQSLEFYPQRRQAIARGGGLYLFGARVFKIRYLSFNLGSGANNGERHTVNPVISFSGLDGIVLGANGAFGKVAEPLLYHFTAATRHSARIRLSYGQTLLASHVDRSPVVAPTLTLGSIRALADATRGPAPFGDPLSFHDILPDPNPISLFLAPPTGRLSLREEVSYHMPGNGRRIYNLDVSRLPEVSLNGILPLTHVPILDIVDDGVAFRHYLRTPVIYVQAQSAYGYDQEHPSGVSAWRRHAMLGLTTQPLLVGYNTVIQPSASVTANEYSNTMSSYRYQQLSIATNHYFTDRSAVGLSYKASNQQGDSPFNFDVLDATQELDGRVQFGDRRLAMAGMLRYDVHRRNLIDYTAAVAIGKNGITPTFSYSFQNRGFGIGWEIEGITF